MRLQRRGKRNHPTYRVVVAEQHAPIKGKFIADVGSYNPHTNEFKVNQEETNKWLQTGTKPSPTVHNLLIENKITKGEKVTSWRPKKKEDEKETAWKHLNPNNTPKKPAPPFIMACGWPYRLPSQSGIPAH